MTILEFLNNAVNFLGSVLKYAIIIVACVWVYGWITEDEYDDDEVTFTVSCRSVLSDMEHYPIYIINYCTELRSETK